MRSSGFSCYVLGSCAAAAMLAGCALPQAQDDMQPQIAPGAMSQASTQDRAHQSSSSGDPLIYGFSHKRNDAVILDYPGGTVVSTFNPQIDEEAACSDDRGDVFLGGVSGSTGTILEYPYGATSPSATQTLGGGVGVSSCSVDNTTGNVAAVVHGADYAVSTLPNFQGPAKTYTYSKMVWYASVGYDASGNLFLLGNSYGPQSGEYALAELPSGGSSFNPISLDLGESIAHIRTVQWDGTYLTIEATVKTKGAKPKDYPQEIFRLSLSGSSAKVVDTIEFHALTGIEPFGSSWIQPNLGAMVYAMPGVRIWKYPAGGKEVLRLLPRDIGPVDFATIAMPPSDSGPRN